MIGKTFRQKMKLLRAALNAVNKQNAGAVRFFTWESSFLRFFADCFCVQYTTARKNCKERTAAIDRCHKKIKKFKKVLAFFVRLCYYTQALW